MMTFKEALSDVLRQPKYDYLTGRAFDIKKVVAEIAETVLDFIFRLLGRSEYSASGYDTDSLIRIFIGVTLIFIIGAIVGTVYLIKRRKKGRILQDSIESILSDLKNRDVTIEDLLHQRDVLADQLQYRESIRLNLIVSLWLLNGKNLIRLADSKTTNQLKRELKNTAPSLADLFYSIVDSYHKAWFGFKQIDEALYEEHKTNFDTLLGEVQQIEK